MTPTIALLFAASITADVVGQILFKIGAERLPDFRGADRLGFFKGLLADWWLLADIATYVAELVIWLRILSEVPISVAFPLASANFLGVAIASRVFLKEQIGRAQWAGAVLITIGVALVATSA